MASPYSSGGGGSKFEDRVVAYYLTALLSETRARGVPGKHVVKALTQRAAFGKPLDDLIITGLLDRVVLGIFRKFKLSAFLFFLICEKFKAL